MTAIENQTPRAKRVVALAMQAANELKHSYIGPEHLLLGIIKLEQGVAWMTLEKLKADTVNLKQRLIDGMSPGSAEHPVNSMMFTPRVKMIMRAGQKQSEALGSDYFGTEHILLGILKVENGAAGALQEEGVNFEEAFIAIEEYLRPGADKMSKSKIGAQVTSLLMQARKLCLEHELDFDSFLKQ